MHYASIAVMENSDSIKCLALPLYLVSWVQVFCSVTGRIIFDMYSIQLRVLDLETNRMDNI